MQPSGQGKEKFQALGDKTHITSREFANYCREAAEVFSPGVVSRPRKNKLSPWPLYLCGEKKL